MRSSAPPMISETTARSSTLFLLALRAVFLLILVSVGMSFVAIDKTPDAATGLDVRKDYVLVAFFGVACIFIGLDIALPRKSLSIISGLFFGLVVGMVVAFGLSLIVDLVVEAVFAGEESRAVISAVKVAIGVICCYLAVSFIIQTKDDVRFVIPYVEFARQTKGLRPVVLDTSVIIDGRIADIVETRVIESELIVPRFVLLELQAIADSNDKLKRIRGRRGLDMLNKLQSSPHAEIRVLDAKSPLQGGVDEALVDLSISVGGRIATNDFNLSKMAQLRGVTVLNINDLANALKPVVLPGEGLTIKIVKPGEEPRQGIGYLDDGTMVVAEGGREHIGDTVQITVTSVLQTSAGRMIFGRIEGSETGDRKRASRG